MPVTTVPWPATVNDAVDRHPEEAGVGPAGTESQSRASCLGAPRSPAPVVADVRTIGRPFEECAADQRADVVLDQLEPAGVDEVALRQDDEAAGEAQEAEDLQVLAGLRHDRVVGGDDEQRQVEAGRAGEHVADEPLVAGHVDDGQPVRRRGPARRSRGRW